MKRDKLTNKIMERVVRYEKSHTNTDVEIWGLGVLIMLGILVFATLEIIRELIESGTIDLLDVIISDLEVTRDLSDELWATINYEFPWFDLIEALAIFIVFSFLVWFFIRRIIKARRTWNQIKKYFEK